VDTNNNSEHRPIESPSGLDLHPQPEKAVRISRRATIGIITLVVLLLVALLTVDISEVSRIKSLRATRTPRSVTPATQAGAEFMQATPAGTVP
jgi:hypothetical protein